MMMKIHASTDYSRIFNSLCHFLALSKTVDTKAVLDNLVITAIALDRESNPILIDDIASAIEVFFSTTLTESELLESLNRLSSCDRIGECQDNQYQLPLKEVAKVKGKAKDAENLETRVKDEWIEKWHLIAENQLPLKADNIAEIWGVLQKYLSKSFYRHGVQTSQLFLPDFKPNEDISESLAKLLQKSIDESKTTLPNDFIKTAVSDFLKNPSVDRVNYLAQLLDSTFSFFAVNLDDAVSNFLSGSFNSLKIFLDTNFIFGILGLHNHPLVDVSHELVSCIDEHFKQIKLYYHAATVEEMQRTVNTLSDRLINRNWNYNLSKAGLKSDELSGL